MQDTKQLLGEFQTVPSHIEEQADALRNNVNYYLRRFQEAQQELQSFIHQNGLSNSEWTLVVPKKTEDASPSLSAGNPDAAKRD